MIAFCSTYYLYTLIEEEEEQHLKQAVKNNHILAFGLSINKEHETYPNENREGYGEGERAQEMNMLPLMIFLLLSSSTSIALV
ncbi:MAG TPA: hypothetical protein VN239_04710 [Nitrososphaera sp.]|jgi:hypothetical protein|nr:hypothetical protein [Nitrososphaera sp.]